MRKLVLIPGLVMLAACSILPKPKSHPVTRYALALPAAASAAAPAAKPMCAAVLRVQNVEATPPFATDDLLYTQSPHEISSYAWHRWAASPATLLTSDITTAVSAESIYRAVLGPTDPGDADFSLAVRLDQGPLQVFAPAAATGRGGASTSTERLAFTATLANNATGTVLATKTFAGSADAAPNPYGGVQSAGMLSRRLVGDLLKWLGNVHGTACARK